MKAKLKGANGFVRFLLQHGEKIGIAAILVVAGMLVYSSFGRPIVDAAKQPDRLNQAASSANSHVAGMSWEAFPPEEQTNYAKFSAGSGELVLTPVKPDQYPAKEPWNPNVIPPVKLRQDPVLVAAMELEVRPGSGLWLDADPDVILEKMRAAAKEARDRERELADEAARMAEGEEGRGGGRPGRGGMGMDGRGGGMGFGDMAGSKTKDGALVIPPAGGAQMQGFEDIREKSWVTVLAKVPIKQQFQMYEDALASARGFNVAVDQPRYLGYVVERAEVTEEGTGKFQRLATMTAKTLTTKISEWPPSQSMDPGNPKYNHPLLTHPLPPMIMREWGNEITHSDLPIPTPEDLMREAEEAAAAQMPAAEEEVEGAADDPFGRAAKKPTMQPGGVYGGRMEGMGMGRPPMMGMGRGMEGGMGRPPGMGMGRGMEGGMSMGMAGRGTDGTVELPEYAWDGLTKTVLFRFFDDTVQPGRRYRYRIQLVMQDVNADQQPKFLDPTVTARQTKDPKRFRMSEWSEPSPVAVVPQPGLIFIAQTKDVASDEPEARLIVKSVDSANAAEIAHNEWYSRGSVLNFAKQAQIIWSSLYKIDPAGPQDSPVFRFLTGLTLVDVDGGDQLTPKNRKLMAPSRALVMDSSGRLLMQNELDEAKTIKTFDYIMQQSADADRRAREGAEGRGPGGGGRGGGGRR